MNKHGVSRRWFAKTDVKYFKSDALRIITNTTGKEYTLCGKMKEKILHRPGNFASLGK